MYKRNHIVACYVFLFLFDYTSCVNGHMIVRCNNAHNLVTNIHIATALYANLHTEWDVMATDWFGYNSFALSLFLPMRSLNSQRTRCLWLCRCLHIVVVAHIFHSLNFWFLTNHLRKWKLIFFLCRCIESHVFQLRAECTASQSYIHAARQRRNTVSPASIHAKHVTDYDVWAFSIGRSLEWGTKSLGNSNSKWGESITAELAKCGMSIWRSKNLLTSDFCWRLGFIAFLSELIAIKWNKW